MRPVETTFRPFSGTMGWFNGWFGTRWYAMLYSHRDEEDAAKLVWPVIAKGGLKPGQLVLDMACGRGRHAAIFAQAGMDVTGIDLSPQSIEEAREKVPGAHFEVFDIRSPHADNRFDAVVCLFNSLGYSPDRADDQRAVNAAAAALKPGGLFVLDLLNADHAVQHIVPCETQDIGDARFHLLRGVEGTNIVKRILVEHHGRTETYVERVHAWALPEVEDLIRLSGLVMEDVTDETCLQSFAPDRSGRIVAWARKKP